MSSTGWFKLSKAKFFLPSGKQISLSDVSTLDRFEDLNKGGFLVHLVDQEIEMTKKPPRRWSRKSAAP